MKANDQKARNEPPPKKMNSPEHIANPVPSSAAPDVEVTPALVTADLPTMTKKQEPPTESTCLKTPEWMKDEKNQPVAIP